MDLAFTAEEEQFRQDVRSWVHSNLPKSISDKVHAALHLTRDDLHLAHHRTRGRAFLGCVPGEAHANQAHLGFHGGWRQNLADAIHDERETQQNPRGQQPHVRRDAPHAAILNTPCPAFDTPQYAHYRSSRIAPA